MTELEELMAQKREIEEKIKRAKNKGVVITTGAKLDVQHYPTAKPDDWYISVAVRPFNTIKWRGVIRGESREEVIAQLPLVIADLQELQDKLQNEG